MKKYFNGLKPVCQIVLLDLMGGIFISFILKSNILTNSKVSLSVIIGVVVGISIIAIYQKSAKQLVGQKNELLALDAKSKVTFGQFKSDDTAKAQAELDELESRIGSANRGKLLAEIQCIEDKICRGNLSESELDEMNTLNTDINAYEMELRTLDAHDPAAEAVRLKERQAELEQIVQKNISIVSALQSFAAKRAELSLAPLKMPNVNFKLFEIVKTTGEVRDVFRFTYKGTDVPVGEG